MTDDLQREEELFFKELNKPKSYLGKVPSVDFYTEAYELFLEIATPEELEFDVLKRETLEKMTEVLFK
jgi:hypothetical protein